MTDSTTDDETTSPRILWIDGCFDMFHYGHANAIRQAKFLFPNVHLVVGGSFFLFFCCHTMAVHPDSDIRHHKGPPVMTNEERYAAVGDCRWVDELVCGAPYTTEVDVLRRHNCEMCIHGEDVSYNADGTHTYQAVIDAGMYMTVPRTRGVSTTNLVNRLLDAGLCRIDPVEAKRRYSMTQRNPTQVDEDRCFFPSALRIREFSVDLVAPTDEDRIVYVDGTYDLFHWGHIEFFKKARELGTYLVVGVYDDETVRYLKGKRFPLLSLHERVLSVLACRLVDDVIIGAPYAPTEQMIRSYGISVVAVGTVTDLPPIKSVDQYQVPKKKGIFVTIESPRPELTITKILARIGENIQGFTVRQHARPTEKEIFQQIEDARRRRGRQETVGEDQEREGEE